MAQQERDVSQDPASPYYLHPSDFTGLKLVSSVFDGSSYGNWKRTLIIGLPAKNKMGFVDGSLPKPSAESATFKAWNRCNSMVIGWIIAVLDPQIAGSILFVDTAREIWLDLEERFGHASSA